MQTDNKKMRNTSVFERITRCRTFKQTTQHKKKQNVVIVPMHKALF